MLNGALGLGISLYFADQASAGLDSVVSKFKLMDSVSTETVANFERQVKQFKVGVKIMAAGAAVLGTAFALADPAGKFEQSLADLQSISGATATEFQQLRVAALDAGVATQFNPTEAVHALRELAAQGFSAQESMTLLKPALDLAAASLGELGVAEAAQLSAQMLKAFGIEASDAAKSVDKLLQASNLFALSPKDLPLALGIGSRGAQLMHQTLDETLVSLGLVKNIIPTVERASTAVAVAMQKLAAPTKREQKEIDELGFKIADAHGNFLPFLDVIQNLSGKLKGMSQQQQALKLERIFGAEALGGVQAIMTQVNNGIKTTTGEVVTGAAAIAYLRKQMAEADGVAKEFADRRLDTFEGQKTLLKGSMETLAIALGEPFAKALKPVVAGITGFVNRIIQIVNGIPTGVKEGIARFVVAFGGILTLFGALVAMKAAIAAVGIVIAVAGGAIASAAVAMLPVLAALGAGILLFKALQVNAESTGNSVLSIFGKIALLFRALGQVFSSGEFSGDVLNELNKAENGGIKAFAIKIYVWAGRIEQFLTGLSEGFRQAVIALQPVFDVLLDSLSSLGAAFGLQTGSVSENMTAWEKAAEIGRSVGSIFAGVAAAIAAAVATVTEVVTAMVSTLGPAFDTVVGVLKLIVGVLTGDWKLAWRGGMDLVFGLVEQFVGIVFRVGHMIAWLVDMVGKLAGKDLGARNFVSGIQEGFHTAMQDAKNWVIDAAGASVGPSTQGLVTGRAAPVPGFYKLPGGAAIPDTLAGPSTLAFASSGLPGISYTPAPLAPGGFRPLGANESLIPPAAVAAPLLTESQLLSRAEKAKGAPLESTEVEEIRGKLADATAQLAALRKEAASGGREDIHVHSTLVVDGAVLSKTVQKANRSDAARSFKATGDDS